MEINAKFITNPKYTTIEKGEIVTKDLSKEEFITLMGKLSKIAKKRKRDKLIKSNITKWNGGIARS